jgi:septum formation protein
MILDKLDYLNKKTIILASKSPRRINLLQEIGLNFKSIDSKTNENSKLSNPIERSMEHARAKLENTLKLLHKPADILISSDTVVSYQNMILEKPTDIEDARKMLQALSDQTHDVYTSVVLKTSHEKIEFTEKSTVTLYSLSDLFINSYIKSMEPMDKAGSYGIQGMGSTFVKSINGCYYNVMGLPVSKLCLEILNLLNENKL